MAKVLKYLNDASLPVSHLDSTARVRADDLFIVEDLAQKKKDLLILLEQKLSAIMLEFGIDSYDDPILAPLIAEFKLSSSEYKHEPYKISYDTLSSALLEDIRRALNFNTMAYRESYQHSRLGHEHDYSKVECFTNYKLSDITNDENVELSTLSSWLGSMTIWKKESLSSDYLPVKYDVFMPKIEIPPYETPQVGEMRLAIQTNEFTEMSSDEGETEEIRCSCDIAILIDHTGSMGLTIKKVGSSLDAFFGDLDKVFEENDIDDWRARIIGYRDKTCDDQWFTVMTTFSRDIEYLKTGVQALSPSGGGDMSESTVDAIDAAMRFGTSILGEAEDPDKWRPFSDSSSPYGQMERLLLVFTDADTKGSIDHTINQARSKNFKIALVGPSTTNYDQLYSNDDITINTYVGDHSTRKYANCGDFNARPVDILSNLAVRIVDKFEVVPPVPNEKHDYIDVFKDRSLLSSTSSDYYWAYCTGQTISCGEDEFTSACSVFAGNPRATQFTIPRCNSFMRLNPRKKYEDALEKVEYENALSAHAHTIAELDSTKELLANAKITIPTIRNGCGAGVEGTAIHSGSNSNPNYTTWLDRLTCTVDVEGSSISSSAEGSTSLARINRETHPAYVQVPMIVFLGAK